MVLGDHNPRNPIGQFKIGPCYFPRAFRGRAFGENHQGGLLSKNDLGLDRHWGHIDFGKIDPTSNGKGLLSI